MMTSKQSFCASAMLSLLLGAASSLAGAAPAPAPSASPAPAATPTPAPEDRVPVDDGSGLSSDQIEVRDYPLTMERVEKFVAAINGIRKAEASSPEVKGRIEATQHQRARSLDEQVKKIEKGAPEGLAAIKDAGLTAREYSILTVSLFLHSAAVEKKKADGTPYPPTLTLDNAQFLEQNWSKVRLMLRPFFGEDEGSEEPQPLQ